MTTQLHKQTSEEIATAITLLICIADSTDSHFHQDWHQALQGNVNQLIATFNLLEKQSVLDGALLAKAS